ncbi:hypothetical protein [Burkholderia sp. BE17]|uniref:hypothetical protein n=1 Tax=Burkholderia sp. BE17 TaxID=2656644 RepID=UPI00128DCE06|nr:hypothetical protein [Burkholderia sp. BE17]MPV65119.1 hypothetical protein [Burkholderia sp. BE17]
MWHAISRQGYGFASQRIVMGVSGGKVRSYSAVRRLVYAHKAAIARQGTGRFIAPMSVDNRGTEAIVASMCCTVRASWLAELMQGRHVIARHSPSIDRGLCA